MKLNEDEREILAGKRGKGYRKAMEILVALGDLYEAERLIPVSSTQVSGVSFKTIGEAGLEFIKDWSGDVQGTGCLSTLNPAGVDLDTAKEMGFPEDFIKKQGEIIEAYTGMGILPSCTCTPYLAGNLPGFGDHIAWAESSSVIFANSVLGARTNRESGVSALASALLGKTPLYGLHLEENRRATFVVDIDIQMEDSADYSAMGFHIGQNYDGIPFFRFKGGGEGPTLDDLKSMGAALAVGSISMFHFQGATPEAATQDLEELITVQFTKKELKEAYEKLNTLESGEEPELIAIGCPHASLKEALKVLESKTDKIIWLFVPRQTKNLLEARNTNKNIKIISDTCMVVSPLEKLDIKSIGVNSAKAAFYSYNLSGLKVRFLSLDKLLK